MSVDRLIKSLNGRKLFTGKADQFTEWSQIFRVRRDWRGYYITWIDSEKIVEGTHGFHDWVAAKEYVKEHWKRLVDEEFERQVLIGSEGSKADDGTENPPASEGD